VTTTLPVLAPLGTVTVMLESLQLEAVAAMPLKVTALLPCVAPKPLPEIVIAAPTEAEAGDRPEILGPEVGTRDTDALADCVGSATAVAVTVIVCAELITAGAV